jgi:hypothetical protein
VAVAVVALIDSLFTPATQIVDPGAAFRLQQHFVEVECLPHLTLETILATGITWDNFRRFFKDKVVRTAVGVFVRSNVFVRFKYNYPHTARVQLVLDRNDSELLFVAVRSGAASENLVATCNFLVHLWAVGSQ